MVSIRWSATNKVDITGAAGRHGNGPCQRYLRSRCPTRRGLPHRGRCAAVRQQLGRLRRPPTHGYRRSGCYRQRRRGQRLEPPAHLPADGTFVSTSPRGEVYRIAGGAPLYVSNWAVFGGAQPTTTVDAGDIDNAGAGSVWA